MRRPVLLLVLMLVVLPCRAGVTSRDLFEPGDGLLTYDEVHEREWLDLTATTDLSLAEVLDAIQPGGSYAGFQLATRSDVQELAESIKADRSDRLDLAEIFTPENPSTEGLVDLLGVNVEFTGSFFGDLRFAYGLTTDELLSQVAGPIRFIAGSVAVVEVRETAIPGALNRSAIARQPASGATFLFQDEPVGFAQGTTAFWAFRPAVAIPEPSTACLAVVACLAALRLRAFA